MQLIRHDVPVAYGMVELIDSTPDQPRFPFSHFCCCWMAFNNIYFVLSQRRSQEAIAAGAAAPAKSMSEKKQIQIARSEFTAQLKADLIDSPHFNFFATRSPKWNGRRITHDANGNRVNGVVNLGFSAFHGVPILTQIDLPIYERWRAHRYDHDRDRLARQLVAVLYTVRNNTMHGGKEWDDHNARAVVDNAYPLLRGIVNSFLVR